MVVLVSCWEVLGSLESGKDKFHPSGGDEKIGNA
jgi:hypothetical protein